jgi:hypothetical protein
MSLYPGTFIKGTVVPPLGITNPAGLNNLVGISITKAELKTLVNKACNFTSAHSFGGMSYMTGSSPTARTYSGITPPTSMNGYWYGYSYGATPIYSQGGSYSNGGGGGGNEIVGVDAIPFSGRLAQPGTGLSREPMLRSDSDYSGTGKRLNQDVQFYPSMIGSNPVLLVYAQFVGVNGAGASNLYDLTSDVNTHVTSQQFSAFTDPSPTYGVTHGLWFTATRNGSTITIRNDSIWVSGSNFVTVNVGGVAQPNITWTTANGGGAVTTYSVPGGYAGIDCPVSIQYCGTSTLPLVDSYSMPVTILGRTVSIPLYYSSTTHATPTSISLGISAV